MEAAISAGSLDLAALVWRFTHPRCSGLPRADGLAGSGVLQLPVVNYEGGSSCQIGPLQGRIDSALQSRELDAVADKERVVAMCRAIHPESRATLPLLFKSGVWPESLQAPQKSSGRIADHPGVGDLDARRECRWNGGVGTEPLNSLAFGQ